MTMPILDQRRIIITCGTGGVGKTTLSAALAVRAALEGKNAVVITIDPAKRLATSLGLSVEALGDKPEDLTPALKAAAPHCKGRLHAIVPDTRKTFEDFIHSLTSSPSVADRVIRNPIFQIFAKEFSGTNEYMALERLYSLALDRRYDCIVLDTPPSRNTLAFLDAPSLLARLFEEKLIRWLVLPANKLMASGIQKILTVLEKLTGEGFMTHLFEFAAALFEVQGTFVANLKKINALLASEEVGFVMVAGPSPEAVPEIRHFISALDSHQLHFDGILVNRTLGHLKRSDANDPETEKALKLVEAMQERERKILTEIRGETKTASVYEAELPELSRDVHSIEDLIHVAQKF
jgi:anion-transporting  ArsA/GET3 family ATPase